MTALCDGIRVRVAEQYARAQQMLQAVDVEGDPEALHQYRVSLRRARSLLTLYRASLDGTPAAAIASSLSEQAAIANLARDLDVFWPTLADGPLKDRVAALRRDAYQAFVTASQAQERERALVHELLQLSWPESDRSLVQETARVRSALVAKIERQCQRLQSQNSTRQWHRLRILIKRWRYLENLCGDDADVSQLKTGQTLLGDFNDLCCQLTLLKRLQRCDERCAKAAKQARVALKGAKEAKKVELDHWIHTLVAKKGADKPLGEKSR